MDQSYTSRLKNLIQIEEAKAACSEASKEAAAARLAAKEAHGRFEKAQRDCQVWRERGLIGSFSTM